MDYLTNPTSKRDLRKLAIELREHCNVPQCGPFPVLFILDRLRDLFFGCDYIILTDDCFKEGTMAQCKPNDRGGYTIEIPESVYTRARKDIGADLGFICHEICHIFLFEKGFTPIFEYSFQPHSLPAYRSVEWQAMYLCGEVLIPYNESKGMSIHELIGYYHVSNAYAISRTKKD